MTNETWKMTGYDFKNSNIDKAIISVGSCETHGMHMPFGTDTFVAYKLSCEIADKVDGLMAIPPITMGYSEHYGIAPFEVSIKCETLIAVLKDALTSILNYGIKHIFIMNGHDGNIAPIEVAAREFKVAHPEVKIAALNDWWVAAGNILPDDTFEVWNGLGHAGEGETSIGLALFEDLMEMEHADGVVPDLPEHIDIKWNFAELTDCCATGDPTKGTKEKGEKMRKAVVDVVVKFMNDMDACEWNYNSKRNGMK